MQTVAMTRSLLSPYFKPTYSNIPNLSFLTGFIALEAIKATCNGLWLENMDKAVDFFRKEDANLESFSAVFYRAVTHGFIPFVGAECSAHFLREKLSTLLKNQLTQNIATQLFDTLKTRKPYNLQEDASIILESDCNILIEQTLQLIDKVSRFIQTILSIVKIWRLTAPLFNAKLSFPLNYPRGLFMVIMACLGGVVVCQVVVQRTLANDQRLARESAEAITSRMRWIESNRLQIVSIPEKNRETVMKKLQEGFQKALQKSASVQMGYMFQSQTSFVLPLAFQIFINLIRYQFAKHLPQEEDDDDPFFSLAQESVQLLWQFSYFVQNLVNSDTYYRLAAEKIQGLLDALNKPETQNIKFSVGDRVELKNLNVSIGGRSLMRNLNVTLPLGNLYYLGGDNGSGKSVLCQALQELISGQGGEIVKPQEVVYLKPELAIRSEPMTFREFLESHFGIEEEVTLQKIQQKLCSFQTYSEVPQVTNGETRDWGALSAGQKQILNWIVMLELTQPAGSCLLIGDETLPHIDQNTRPRILQLLEEWMNTHREQRAIILIEHQPSIGSFQAVKATGDAGFRFYQVNPE